MSLDDIEEELRASYKALTEALEVVQPAHDGSSEDYAILVESILTAWNAVRRARVDITILEAHLKEGAN